MDREQLGAWAMEARIFMRGSIEGLALVPPGIVIEHQDVGAGRILVCGAAISVRTRDKQGEKVF